MRVPSSSLESAAERLEPSVEVTVLLDAESLLEVFLNGSQQPAVRIETSEEPVRMDASEEPSVRTEESEEPAVRIEIVFPRLTFREGDLFDVLLPDMDDGILFRFPSAETSETSLEESL